MRPILILAAAALLTPPAFASDPAAMRSVSFTDLNLASPADRQTLDRRIERAARAICATNPVTETQAVASERARCIEATVAGAQMQVGAAISASATQTAGL